MKNLNIAVLDDSFMVQKGLQAVLSRYKFIQHITFVDSFGELESKMQKIFYHMVMINPGFLQHDFSQFDRLKNQFICVKWIGIVYTHYADELLNNFYGTIDIFDSQETITGKMLKWTQSLDEEVSQQSRDTLTDREIDVLKLLAIGKSNKGIADTLNISINTAITHRKNISQKTGIKSVAGLTIYAVVQNLVSLENY
ncbi:MAG: response regulator transcription factor [Paludibacteraceae bacterium]